MTISILPAIVVFPIERIGPLEYCASEIDMCAVDAGIDDGNRDSVAGADLLCIANL